MDIRRWLEGLSLGQYAELFAQHEIDLEMLQDLDENDLEKLGVVSLGHRKKILRAAAGLDAPSAPPSHEENYGEEIELRHYLNLLWSYRKIFFASAMLFTLGFWAFKGLQFFRQAPPSSYYVSLITLSFPGYERAQYPNGSAFAISDIIASNVLREVYHRQNLVAEDIPLNEFIKAFKVSFVSLEKDFIIETYTKRLNALDEKLLAQAEELQTELQEELERSSRSQVLIQFEKDNDWSLRQAQVYAMLESVPLVWQEIAVLEKGIFTPNVARYGAAHLFNYVDIFGSSEPLVGLEKLKKNISYFKNYIGDLEQLPNIHNYTLSSTEIGQSITVDSPQADTPLVAVDTYLGATSLSLNDISKSLFEVDTFTIPRLVFSYTDMGIIEDTTHVLMFYDSQIFELERNRELLKSQVEVVEDVISSYAALIGQDQPLNNAVPGSPGGATSTIPQFDDSFLSSIIDLAGKSDDLAYKKSLMEELKRYKLDLTQISNDIAHLEQLKQRITQDEILDPQLQKAKLARSRSLKEDTRATVHLLARLMQAALLIEDKTGERNYLDRSMFTSLGYSEQGRVLPEIIGGGNLKIFAVGMVVLLLFETLGVFLHAYLKENGQAA